jgi:hypothetical protein
MEELESVVVFNKDHTQALFEDTVEKTKQINKNVIRYVIATAGESGIIKLFSVSTKKVLNSFLKF